MKKLILLFLFIGLNMTLFAQDEIPDLVENMPTFGTCSEKGTEDERRACTQLELLKYIYANITYPDTAKKNGIEGIVVIGFVISETGEVTNVKTLKGIGGGCAEEVVRVIESTNGMWKEGTEGGKPTAVRHRYPVRFRLTLNGNKNIGRKKKRKKRKKN